MNKVDKIKRGYILMVPKEDIKRINHLTKITGDKLFFSAMKISNNDERKAISLLFNNLNMGLTQWINKA